MKTHVITIVVGTLVLFIWNAISWMALPFHANSMKNIPDQVIQKDVLKESMPESGVYHYPGMPDMNNEAEMQKTEAILKEGPRITLMVYKNAPSALFDPMTFMVSLLFNLITVILTYFIVLQLKVKEMKPLLISMIALAFIAAFISDFSQMNWFMFPWDYTFANVFDKIMTFVLLGLVFSFVTFRNKATSAE